MDYNLYEKSEQHQNDLTKINCLHNQSLQGDPVLKCEHQQWDIKPDPYLLLKQDIAPDLRSEQPASNFNPLSHHDQQHQGNILIASSNEYTGFLILT